MYLYTGRIALCRRFWGGSAAVRQGDGRMAQLYQCMHFSIEDFMRYGRIVACAENGRVLNGRKEPGIRLELDVRYLSTVYRRESAAAEACAIASGRFYAQNEARRFDLRDLFLSCRVGSYRNFEPDMREYVPDDSGRTYDMDAVLRELFLSGVCITGLRSLVTGATWPKERDHVVFRSFLRSASMSRNGDLSFAAQEICDKVLDHCSLGFLGSRQPEYPWAAGSGVLLSKFEAYMGLALSDAAPVRQLSWPLNEETVVVLTDTVFSKMQCEELLKLESKDSLKRQTTDRSLQRARWPHGCCWEPDEKGILKDELVPAEWGELTPFDGEGILSMEAAAELRRSLGLDADRQQIASFQIRMPMCKGVLHAVDFHRWVQSGDSGFAPEELQCEDGIYVYDRFRRRRDLSKARILLTESMFKCHKWVEDCAKAEGEEDPMRWYFARLNERLALPANAPADARRPAALWVCRYNKTAAQQGETTLTNYQILHTTGFDLNIHMALAEASVKQYAALARADAEGDAERYARYALHGPQAETDADDADGDAVPAEWNCNSGTGDLWLRRSMGVLPQLLYTTRAQYSMRSWGESYRKDAQAGRLEVRGATRLLSADLMTFLWALGLNAALTAKQLPVRAIRSVAEQTAPWELGEEEYDAPCTAAAELRLQNGQTIFGAGFFRNPHMSREEHLLLRSFADAHDEAACAVRQRYLGHLEGVVMLAARSMGAARLSGADFDGDIVRVITEPVYVQGLYNSLADSQQAMGLVSRPGVLLPCLPLVNIKKQSGRARKVTAAWLQQKPRHTLHLNEYEMWDEARHNNVGHFSNLGVNFGAVAYSLVTGAETEQQRAERAKAETYVRRLTALVGYEIDSIKTGFKPQLPAEMEILARNYQPFLKYNTAARTYRKASVYSFYPSAVRALLNDCTSREGAQRLAGTDAQPGWQACWLNLLPWYLQRAGGEALGRTGSLEEAGSAVTYTAAQLRGALGAVPAEQWSEEQQQHFLRLAALCRAWQETARKKEEPDSGAREQIVRSLFMQQPQRPVEQTRRLAEQLIETLKGWYLQAGEKKAALQAAQKFRSRVSAPEFLLLRGTERTAALRQALQQLCETLLPGAQEEEAVQAFAETCARTDRDGYRVPLLAAIGAEEWLHAVSGFDLTQAGQKAEQAAARLETLCAAPVTGEVFGQLVTQFTAMLARCRTGGERLQQLRALQQLLPGPAEGEDADRQLAELALACADRQTAGAAQFAALYLSEEAQRTLWSTITTESGSQRFLWDCAGPALYRTILRTVGAPETETPDFARLRAELTAKPTGGEPV